MNFPWVFHFKRKMNNKKLLRVNDIEIMEILLSSQRGLYSFCWETFFIFTLSKYLNTY